MNCALCKQPIRGDERTVGVTHYACEVQLTDSWRADLDAMTQQRDALRAALEDLRINANRLCDRNLGGTYEDDCRRSIAGADAALAATSPATSATLAGLF